MEVKMKKLFAISLIIIILCPILSVCNVAANLTHFLYDNEELYTVGDGVIEDKIDRVEIDWIRGDIKIEYHSLENIRFTEKNMICLNWKIKYAFRCMPALRRLSESTNRFWMK